MANKKSKAQTVINVQEIVNRARDRAQGQLLVARRPLSWRNDDYKRRPKYPGRDD